MKVTIYIEGGGHGPNSASLQQTFRSSFRQLLIKAGFTGRLPKIVACGPRRSAYESFRDAPPRAEEYPILLVDSESLVDDEHRPSNPAGAWQHLQSHDSWARPSGAADDQAQMMVTTMETWLLVDRSTFTAHFPGMTSNRLPPERGLEARSKDDVTLAIHAATRNSSKGAYEKGRDSFELLAKVNPDVLKAKLPHFRRFVEALDTHA